MIKIFQIFTWEKMLSAQHLSKNTTNRPHVNCCAILQEREKNLRCTVPSCCHILSHVMRWLFRLTVDTTSHACQENMRYNASNFLMVMYMFLSASHDWIFLYKNLSSSRKVGIHICFIFTLYPQTLFPSHGKNLAILSSNIVKSSELMPILFLINSATPSK